MLDIILGVLAVIYGIFTFIQRKRKPESFAKIESMKKLYGEKAGYIVHVISYSVIPIIFGITIIILSSVYGMSIFD